MKSRLFSQSAFSFSGKYYRLCECVNPKEPKENGTNPVPRMNGRNRKKWYQFLAARDSEFCAWCGKAGSVKTLIIDHIDNNNRNNDPENYQLLCRSCNTKKNPRRKSKPKTESVEISEPLSSKELIKNEKCEPIFRTWIETQALRWRRLELKDAINSGAEVAGISPATAERYLNKMCSSAGKFRVVMVDGVKFVELKDCWNADGCRT